MGLLFVALGAWPFIEQWITGDKRAHNVADRPRNAPVRTGLGVAGIICYGVLWLAGSNDILSETFSIDLYLTTYIFRVLVIAGPIAGFIVTKRICLGLQRRDRETLEHGYESGIIQQLPSGEFIEVHKESSDETTHVLENKPAITSTALEEDETDDRGVENPEARKPKGKLRRALAHWYTKDNVSFEGVAAHSGHHLHHSADGDEGAH